MEEYKFCDLFTFDSVDHDSLYEGVCFGDCVMLKDIPLQGVKKGDRFFEITIRWEDGKLTFYKDNYNEETAEVWPNFMLR